MRKLKLEELNRVDVADFKNQQKFPIAIVLDNVRSGHNVGAAFRTADAFNVDHMVLVGITPRPPHKEIFKSAIGATESVSWSYSEYITQAIEALKEQGFLIVGIEQMDNSESLENIACPQDQKIAVVFGNEVSGISDEAIPLLDIAIEVPQFGTKHSLNVSVCLGVVLWELIRSRV